MKAASGIMLTLLLISILTLAFNTQPVKAAQLVLETDKHVYVLGENVTVILKNIGVETVQIGGYPAWQIFTYPGEELVYPKVFAFLAWSLDPGENDTATWNQYNEFTESPAEPGKYVVRDTQGWGLTAYFDIISAEQWVPYAPLPNMVDLVFWTKNRVAYINVTITFSDAGYKVSEWGTVVKDGFEIWVDSEIWDWTGPAALVITTLRHTYDLGRLKEGDYIFTFKAWGFPVKSISFTIPPSVAGDANNDGTVNMGDLSVVSAHWYPGPPIGPLGYDASADLDNDGTVNMIEVAIISANWGQTVP